MKIVIRILTLALILMFFQEKVVCQFYIQGGFSLDNTSKELNKLAEYNSKPVYRLGIGQEIKLKKYFVLDAGLHLMNINKQTFNKESQSTAYNFALPIQFRVRPTKYFDVGLGIMPSVTSTNGQTILESPISYYGLLSLGINVHKSLTIEGIYNYGLKNYKNLSLRDQNGSVLLMQDFRHQFFSITAKVKF
jgi:hypothetical protein